VESGVPGGITSFEDLLVYRRLVDLHLELNALTLRFPRFELYELGSQLRRSSNSIAANLAEGWNSKHSAIYVEGLNRALGELRETRHHLAVAFRKGYLLREGFEVLDSRLSECGRMLRGLQRSMERRTAIRRDGHR
jgi:four helix bundle protein